MQIVGTSPTDDPPGSRFISEISSTEFGCQLCALDMQNVVVPSEWCDPPRGAEQLRRTLYRTCHNLIPGATLGRVHMIAEDQSQ